MGVWKKVLNFLGAGGVEIKTDLNQSELKQGDPIEGVVLINGGERDQQINQVSLKLAVQTWYYGSAVTSTPTKVPGMDELVEYNIRKDLEIKAGTTHQIPFSISIPNYTPVSSERSPIVLITTAQIPNGLQPMHKLNLVVTEHELVSLFLDSMKKMGFTPQPLQVDRDEVASVFYEDVDIRLFSIQEYKWQLPPRYQDVGHEIRALLYTEGDDLKVWMALHRDDYAIKRRFNREQLLDGEWMGKELERIISA